ncbi:hypothetical protein A3A75_03920 [Candidatus Woesebacteria bacterium RIFCSPLOWO2_01_FULL_39_10]|uniref:Uncharacterized protein n=1 Tax=Candidatus Woesebacteria bacterium RIFCSPLOWO2_01_FULL_39_10 TaxID=1802516 RepID=A0A1F8B752_9BACT|nr:MAG: hypothetical protein A3A75_03920 [Candidatus Woesebacteria bacterium RIFCSPLOWO2_01_FULL_39_10]
MGTEIMIDKLIAGEPMPMSWAMASWQEEGTSGRDNPEAFVADELRSYANDIATWRVPVGPEIQIVNLDTNNGVAETLARITLDDPTLEKMALLPSDLSQSTEDQIAQAIAVTLAKARAVEENRILSPKEKSSLDRFIDEVVDTGAKVISRVGGRKGRAATAALALIATACGSVGQATNTPNPSQTPPGVEVTVELPTSNPTAEPTAPPTSEPTPFIEVTPPPLTETPPPSRLDAINAGGVLPILGGAEGVTYQPPTKLEVSAETLEDLVSQGYTVNLAPGDFSGQTACRVANPDDCYKVLTLPPSLFYQGKLYNLSGEGSQSGAVMYTEVIDEDAPEDEQALKIWWINWSQQPEEGHQIVPGFKEGVPVKISIDPDGQVSSVKANAIFVTPATSVDIEAGVIDIGGQRLTFIGGEPEIQVLENEALRNLNNELFPPDTSSELVTDHYRFDLRLSEGILDRSGYRYVHLPPEVLEKMFLYSMGRYMYFLRDFYPDEYAEFFEVADKINNLEEGFEFNNNPIYMDLAREKVENGPVPMRFNNAPIEGLVNEVEMNFVSKEEFDTRVIPTLNSEGITFSQKPDWVTEKWNWDSAAFIEGNKLTIYSFNLGVNDPSQPPSKYDIDPLELQENPDRYLAYWLIWGTWRTSATVMQVNFAGRDYGGTQISRYDISNMMVTQDLYCGPRSSERVSMRTHCREILNQTFIPGYQAPPTPAP